MGRLFDLFRDTPANTLAADMAATRHAELVALSHELMGALRALQATIDRKAARPPRTDAQRFEDAYCGTAEEGWRRWPPTTDSCGNG